MKAAPAFQFYPAEFLSGTTLLSAAATGAYIRMLAVAWECGPIPDTTAALVRAMGLSQADPPFADIWAELSVKWHKTSKGWINCRLEVVRWERENFALKQQRNGRQGGRPKTQTEPKQNPPLSFGKPNGEPKPNPTGNPNESSLSLSLSLSSDLSLPPKDQDTRSRAGREPRPQNRALRSQTYTAEFLAFWNLYPRKISKSAAWLAWSRIPSKPALATLTEALAWQVNQPGWTKDGGRFIPHASTWLNQHRWEDEPFAHGDMTEDAWTRTLGKLQ